MPPCKNDTSKKYKGDEPSPKGIGLCAHAETTGAIKKGKDGQKWTVALDKNGIKSWKLVGLAKKPVGLAKKPVGLANKYRKWPKVKELKVPPIVKGATPLTIRSLKFSDGKKLSWQLGHQPQLHDENDEVVPMTRAHWDAVMSTRNVVLRLDRGNPLKDIDVKVTAPATIGKVLSTAHKFYSTKLSAADYDFLEPHLHEWNPLYVGSTMTSFKKYVNTYGDCKGNHTGLNGINGTLFSNVYTMDWDS